MEGFFLQPFINLTRTLTFLQIEQTLYVFQMRPTEAKQSLDQKITIDDDSGSVKKSYGFAKHLHDSLPNATYVGFTGHRRRYARRLWPM